jgi:hypothetical protein
VELGAVEYQGCLWVNEHARATLLDDLIAGRRLRDDLEGELGPRPDVRMLTLVFGPSAPRAALMSKHGFGTAMSAPFPSSPASNDARDA